MTGSVQERFGSGTGSGRDGSVRGGSVCSVRFGGLPEIIARLPSPEAVETELKATRDAWQWVERNGPEVRIVRATDEEMMGWT